MSITSRIPGFSSNGHSNGNGVHGVESEVNIAAERGRNGNRAKEGEERARNEEKNGDGAKAGTARARNGEREASGRFAAGNKGGPGNPYNRRVAMIKRWLLEVVNEEGLKAAGKKLLEQAIEGDVASARVLFQYVMPKHVDPDLLDLSEWEGYKKKAGMMAEMPGLVTKPGPELPLDIVRAAQPLATENWRKMTANALLTPQSKLDEVLGMLKNDPRAAREYLDKGPGDFFGKGNARNEGAARARNGKAQRRKR